uniref:Uncharacterized protein n=1 Tax=Panagrolaimus sp. JU765 TaxID=591449 RepID=A0AC34Q779_9BILA
MMKSRPLIPSNSQYLPISIGDSIKLRLLHAYRSGLFAIQAQRMYEIYMEKCSRDKIVKRSSNHPLRNHEFLLFFNEALFRRDLKPENMGDLSSEQSIVIIFELGMAVKVVQQKFFTKRAANYLSIVR